MTKPAESDQIAKARRISEIAERENKATKGPWEVVAADDYYISAEAYPVRDRAKYVYDNTDKTLAMIGNQTEDCGEANSKFIAHARADIPFLLSALASERQAVIEECAKVAEGELLLPLKAWEGTKKEHGACVAREIAKLIRSMGE